jgi:hypothetical protein
MKEATIEAKQGGERGITARSVKKVTAVCAALLSLTIANSTTERQLTQTIRTAGLSRQVQRMSHLLGKLTKSPRILSVRK